MLGDKRYCYPLTVSDHASRYLLAIEALDSVKERGAFPSSREPFKSWVCRQRSARTTESLLHRPTDCLDSVDGQSGGSGWESESRGSSPAIRAERKA